MTTAIRRADPSDLDVLASLFDAYRRFYDQPGDIAGAHAFLGERLTRGESVVLLAEQAGSAIGFVQLYPIFSSVRMGRVWVLNDLYVAPDARRVGAARALLHAACAFARDDGALGLQLETGPGNHQAQALYHGAGWQLGDNLHFAIDVPPATGSDA